MHDEAQALASLGSYAILNKRVMSFASPEL
jgi:hypothetical protein